MEKKIVILGNASSPKSEGGQRLAENIVSEPYVPEYTDMPWDIPSGRNKKLMVIGDLEVGGERGRVFHNLGAIGTISATEYKDPEKIVKRWKRNTSI